MLSNTWQLQEAKNKFSSLVEKARQYGPQIVTKHGEDVVVILDIVEYKKIITPRTKIIDFFKKSPFNDIGLEIKRRKEVSREIKL